MSETTRTVKSIEELERSLWSACMCNMGLAADWRKQARLFVEQGGTLNDFVLHAHGNNRRKARAAYRLAQSEIAIERLREAHFNAAWL